MADVNAGFSARIGYAREETIGSSILDTAIWDKAAYLRSFRAELNESGIVERRELLRFPGRIGAKLSAGPGR